MDPGEDLHERRLACAVLAKDGDYFASVQVQTHLNEGLRRPKGLA